jgi:transcription factor Dp-1
MQAEEAIQKTAIANGDGLVEKSSKKSSSGKKKRNHDDKNIRRRVYDALNVLMAMDIITKNRKEITWRGLPGSTVKDHLGDGSGNGSGKRKVNGLSRRQRVQQLQVEVKKRQEDVGKKVEFLQELMTQNVCFQNLLGRNYARDFEDSRRMMQNQSGQSAKAHKVDENEKIPLPFIIVNTDSTAVVQCEMCPRRTNVNFDFSLPFEINDDNEILKRLGM